MLGTIPEMGGTISEVRNMSKYLGTVGEIKKLLEEAEDDDIVLTPFCDQNTFRQVYPEFGYATPIPGEFESFKLSKEGDPSSIKCIIIQPI